MSAGLDIAKSTAGSAASAASDALGSTTASRDSVERAIELSVSADPEEWSAALAQARSLLLQADTSLQEAQGLISQAHDILDGWVPTT